MVLPEKKEFPSTILQPCSSEKWVQPSETFHISPLPPLKYCLCPHSRVTLFCSTIWDKGWNFCLSTWNYQHNSKWRLAEFKKRWTFMVRLAWLKNKIIQGFWRRIKRAHLIEIIEFSGAHFEVPVYSNNSWFNDKFNPKFTYEWTPGNLHKPSGAAFNIMEMYSYVFSLDVPFLIDMVQSGGTLCGDKTKISKRGPSQHIIL